MTSKRDEAYETYWLEQSLPLIRLSCVLGAIAIVFFIRIDDYYLGDYAYVMQAWRLFYMLPVILLWLAMTYHEFAKRYIFWAIATSGMPFGLSFVHSLYLAGPSAALYVGIALMQVCLFVVLLFNLPPRFMIPPVITFVIALLATMIAIDVAVMDQVLALTSVLSVSILGATVSFHTQRKQKATFLQQEEIRQLRRDAARKQQERLDWLAGITGFVRHELRNALAGVNTSLQMVRRHAENDAVHRYSERAHRSAEFISKMLERATEATNLEAALVDEEQDEVDLIDLSRTKMNEYAETYPNHHFRFTVASGVELVGNGDSFEQAIDKILVNAIEHSDKAEPITMRVTESGPAVTFDIENSGDELPERPEEIFDVFFTTKPRNSSNLGIGLYVARKIIEFKGGSLNAFSRPSGSGAIFRISLPKPNYSNHR